MINVSVRVSLLVVFFTRYIRRHRRLGHPECKGSQWAGGDGGLPSWTHHTSPREAHDNLPGRQCPCVCRWARSHMTNGCSLTKKPSFYSRYSYYSQTECFFFLPLKPTAALTTSTSRCAGCLLTKTWSSLTASWASTRSTGPESWSSWPTSFTLTWSSVVWSRLRLTESCLSWRWWCPPEGRGTLRVSWLLLSGKSFRQSLCWQAAHLGQEGAGYMVYLRLFVSAFSFMHELVLQLYL